MNKILIATSFLLFASRSFATFDAQILMGGANAQSTVIGVEQDQSGTAHGSQAGLSLHFDPIPTVPFSFGLIYLNQGFSVSKEKHKSKTFAGVVVGPEIMAWLPTAGSLSPYAKLAYTRVGYAKIFDKVDSGNMEVQTEPQESTLLYSGSGARASTGVNWSAFKYVSFMAEYSMTWTKVHAISIKDGASGETTKVEDAPTESLTTQGLLLGFGGNI